MMRNKSLPFEKSRGTVSVAERLKVLNDTERHAVLATASDGQPYTSLIAFAMTPDMTEVVFATPRKTEKYRNMLKNKQVALLIDTRSNADAAYMKAETVTIIGTARPLRHSRKREELSYILLKKHPALKSFVEAKTTAVIVVEAAECFHTGSFQQVSRWRVR